MPRELNTSMQAALEAGVVVPAIMAQITFASGTQYIWTGIGNLVYDAQTYIGVGSLAGLGAVTEGVEVQADGTTVSLSGIDPTLYGDCMTDIQIGAPAILCFAVLSQGVIVGAPYVIFSGQVDKPAMNPGANSITISLALESRMTNLQRASNRRYTSADQRILNPNDSSFDGVETLSDQALIWGN